MRELSATELKAYLDSAAEPPLLLDVREPWEFERCRIDGSELLPMGEVRAEADRLDPDRETIVFFCNLATWDDEKKTFTHQSPYYAGGNAQGGNAWQLDSPELDTTNLPLKEPKIHDGQYGHISLGKHNSIFIGGM